MGDTPTLSVDPQFSTLGRPLDDLELAELAQSLKDEGCRDPVRYWATDGNPIVDGHHRHRLCTEHGVPYLTIAMTFPDRAAVVRWIIRNQLGRRNLTPAMASILRAKLYLEGKKEVAAVGDIHVTPPPAGSSRGKRGPNVAKRVAQEAGMSVRQIHRDVVFAGDMERLGAKSPQLRDAAMNMHIARSDARVLADAPIEVLRGIEASPGANQRSAAKAAADIIRQHQTAARKKAAKSGQPIYDIRLLFTLEKTAGALMRAKTEAMEACGGRKCEWAWRHHELLRRLMSGWTQGDKDVPVMGADKRMPGVFDIILSWQKEAQAHRGIA